MNRYSRTRIAPTPSGFLHLGNILSFTLTAALAKRSGARTMLRIDDLDRERANDRYIQDIFDTLNFLQIPWHEGPRNPKEQEENYSQLRRIGLYQALLRQLRAAGMLFACSCSRSEILQANPDGSYTGACLDKKLSLDAEGVSWRLRTDLIQEAAIKTGHGIVRTGLPATMRYFVVRKKDGVPAYQLASLADDLHFGVDLIVRGNDLWPSTIAQHFLAELLSADSFSNAVFYHHPLLTETGGRKLSKSAGDQSIQYFRSKGGRPETVYSAIARAAGKEVVVNNWEALADVLYTIKEYNLSS